MTALVSGGSGLVGRYIVNALLGAGLDVVVAGRHRPSDSHFSKPVRFRRLSLDDDTVPAGLFNDVQNFVHAAFDHEPGRYRGGEGDDPDGFRRRNLEGSVRLFETARRAGVSRTVFLSSRAVYDGLPAGEPLVEEASLSPAGLYGQVKHDCEQALAALNTSGFVTASLRLTGVYGGLRPNKWDALVADYLAGREISVRAGSEVHGEDVGKVVCLMLAASAEDIGGRSFNVSDIVADTRDILAGLGVTGETLPEPADKSSVAVMDTRRIRELGWRPGGWPLFAATLLSLAHDAGLDAASRAADDQAS
ncbi:MAG: NAD(P)-dependent oxidoreductase [Hoeflea sp.]|uniref:NAD-dependent epimerase/dehydratase family protein n=1 Tax=Hoeflea sp. TaxID=1940281 RepID=UPI0032EC88C7